MGSARSIKILRLQDRSYTLSDIQQLCKALKKNKSLRTLDLTGVFTAKDFYDTARQEKAFKAIVSLLIQNCYIQELILDANPISKNSVEWLIKAFTKSPLRRVSLQACDFEQVRSVTKIAGALQGSATLQLLNLRDSIALPSLKISPFSLLAIYQKMPNKIIINKNIQDYFEKLMEEKKMKEEFPVIYASSAKKSEEKKGVFSPGWSPTRFRSPNDLKEEEKKIKQQSEKEREFFSLGSLSS